MNVYIEPCITRLTSVVGRCMHEGQFYPQIVLLCMVLHMFNLARALHGAFSC